MTRMVCNGVKRALDIRKREDASAAPVIDRVVLAADDRHRRRLVMTGEAGTRFLLDLPQAAMLRDGDALVLDDGSIVRVVGKREPLVEIVAASEVDRLRIAWHLGNRHVEVQVVGDRLRIRRDHVLEAMLHGLGAQLTPLDAPFDPEQGAYAHWHDDGHI
ncbi:MAG TPA: urease accessory protein UreE [Xanthobacteraceae bacterium]|nr:urease accessory protein UreE [Xanthobacteraceae bacterium]